MDEFSLLDRPIRILHQLPRSGGTIINRCLGSMNKVIMLSEIHPQLISLHRPSFHPLVQASEWFGLLRDEDKPLLDARQERLTLSYSGIIDLLQRRAIERKSLLVIRDFNHPDFIPTPYFPPYVHPEVMDVAEK